jgi:hypothetical protein
VVYAAAMLLVFALQKQQLPWRRLYRGGKPPEEGFMKPKHVV